jgi:predicted transcriptional regulator
MNDMLKLPKGLATRLRKMSHKQGNSPAAIVETAIDEHLKYLEWKEKAIAAGDADIAAGRTLTTGQVLAAISRQRAARGRKSKKTRS